MSQEYLNETFSVFEDPNITKKIIETYSCIKSNLNKQLQYFPNLQKPSILTDLELYKMSKTWGEINTDFLTPFYDYISQKFKDNRILQHTSIKTELLVEIKFSDTPILFLKDLNVLYLNGSYLLRKPEFQNINGHLSILLEYEAFKTEFQILEPELKKLTFPPKYLMNTPKPEEIYAHVALYNKGYIETEIPLPLIINEMEKYKKIIPAFTNMENSLNYQATNGVLMAFESQR
ncbi:MAG: hypothetical protein JXR30_03540 [Alphaproteobacteria bacterium]|nr:hypothetical protein [Alphaproteobacteria bacterium]